MKIIIRKKDFLEAIKNNEKNTQFIEYHDKYGNTSFLKGTNKPTKKGWLVLPLPVIPKGTPFTRWTPKSTTEWYQKKGFPVEISFKYDDLIKGPLKRFSEVKKIKTGEFPPAEVNIETPEPEELEAIVEVKPIAKAPKKEATLPVMHAEKPKQPAEPEKAEIPELSPFPPAVVFNDMILASGQMPIDPKTGKLMRGTFEEETSAALKHLAYSLKICGSNEKKVLKLTVYVTDINQFEFLEDICDEYFSPNVPAFSCIEVKRLPYDVQIQMDAVAYV